MFFLKLEYYDLYLNIDSYVCLTTNWLKKIQIWDYMEPYLYLTLPLT
jgi:hypothetical protein